MEATASEVWDIKLGRWYHVVGRVELWSPSALKFLWAFGEIASLC